MPEYPGNLLSPQLQARLDSIKLSLQFYWNHKRYSHFTNHGVDHSEKVYRHLRALLNAVPPEHQLDDTERFVLFAACWLYEIGMQSPFLQPVLGFSYVPGKELTRDQLEGIREYKHLLSYYLIITGTQDLGILHPPDDYIRLVAEVCRWCSDEPFEAIPEELPVFNSPVRVRLLSALLRLADRLYIHGSRIEPDLLEAAGLPMDQFAKWWVFQYAQTVPIERGKIRFYYTLPDAQKEFLKPIRLLTESWFEYDNNAAVRFLTDNYGLLIRPSRTPGKVEYRHSDHRLREMGPELSEYLRMQPNQDIQRTENGKTRDSTNTVQPPDVEVHAIIKILFLAANPSDTTRSKLGEESRAIDNALRLADYRDCFDVRHYFAVRASDLQGYLLRHKPDIVHFSGQGSEQNEIVFQDDAGKSKPVPVGALKGLFAVLKDNVRCVVLNSCFSEAQAETIAEHIDCVVGMSKEIKDTSSICFSAAFYQALGFGRDLKTAFDLACNQIDLEGLKEQDIPRLIAKRIDPKDIAFGCKQ